MMLGRLLPIRASPNGTFAGEAQAIPASTAAVAEMTIMGERHPSIHLSEIIPPTGAPRAMPMGNLTVVSDSERPGMNGCLHFH
jgi:hypothetical protein